MALMERVATLLRANLNDLIDRAEEPEKMLKQLALDMENQLLQLKTQVAMSLADQHLLERKTREQQEAADSWQRKAELAVSKGDDVLARAALERALGHEGMLAAFRAQVAEGSAESESLRSTYTRLQGKLAETHVQCEVLLAQHRRAQMVSRATQARAAAEDGTSVSLRGKTLHRVQSRIGNAEAQNHAAKALLPGTSLDDRFATMEREQRVEQLLNDLKNKQNRQLAAG